MLTSYDFFFCCLRIKFNTLDRFSIKWYYVMGLSISVESGMRAVVNNHFLFVNM